RPTPPSALPAAAPAAPPAPPPPRVDRARELFLKWIADMGGTERVDAIKDINYEIRVKARGKGLLGKIPVGNEVFMLLPDYLRIESGGHRQIVTPLAVFQKMLG